MKRCYSNPNYIPSELWDENKIAALFINYVKNGETQPTISKAGRKFNLSASVEQWNNAGVQTYGTQASISKAVLLNAQTEVQKYIDSSRSEKLSGIELHSKAMQKLVDEYNSIHPNQYFTIKVNGVAI